MNVDNDVPLPDADAPRVEAAIAAMMKRFPGIGKASQAHYYEEVHQELGPLARQLERELRNANARIAILESQLLAKTELATLYAASLRKVERDGERYLWLRDQANQTSLRAPYVWMTDANGATPRNGFLDMLNGEKLDAAVDAAIAASAKEE